MVYIIFLGVLWLLSLTGTIYVCIVGGTTAIIVSVTSSIVMAYVFVTSILSVIDLEKRMKRHRAFMQQLEEEAKLLDARYDNQRERLDQTDMIVDIPGNECD